MNLKPTLKDALVLAQKANVIPLFFEMYSDMHTPIGIYKKLFGKGKTFLLESVEGGERAARYSFIGFSPFLEAEIYGEKGVIRSAAGEREESGNAADIVRRLMENYAGAPAEGYPRFTGGALGYFGYDVVRSFEKLPDPPKDDLNLPDARFMVVDDMIIFDHPTGKLYIVSNIHNEADIVKEYGAAAAKIERIYKEIVSAKDIEKPVEKEGNSGESALISNMSGQAYVEKVKKGQRIH